MQGGSQRGLHARKYGQLCQSLLDLDLAAESIFNAIISRVNLEHDRLKVLKNRIQSVQSQVDAITGTSQATIVFSSSKYPVKPAEAHDFIPLFGGKIAGTYGDFPLTTILLSTGQCQSGAEGTYELFRFFAETSFESWSNVPKQKGIGSMPTNVKSVADVLLFNSSELPYLNYKFIDNLVASEKLSVQEPTTEPIILPPAPQSVQDYNATKSLGSEDFGFRPILGQVPSFKLPSTLPDLPMVAEISWSGSNIGLEHLPSIAPSAHPKGGPKNSAKTSIGEARTPTSTEHPVSALKKEKLQTSLTTLTLPTSQLPPPPPPLPTQVPVPSSPPLPTLSVPVFGSGNQSEILKVSHQLVPGKPDTFQFSPPIDPQRAALLASIRDPNITLRKTGQAEHKRELSEPLEAQRDSVHEATLPRQRQPVNILAEMATTLKMRRLSMQGAAHDKEQVAAKSGEQFGVPDDPGTSSPSSSSSKFTLPAIANLHAYMSKRDEEVSDNDEEWDD